MSLSQKRPLNILGLLSLTQRQYLERRLDSKDNTRIIENDYRHVLNGCAETTHRETLEVYE